jgi:hypothetical protein
MANCTSRMLWELVGVVGRLDPVTCRDKGGCTHDEVEIVVYTDLASPIADSNTLAGLTFIPSYHF